MNSLQDEVLSAIHAVDVFCTCQADQIEATGQNRNRKRQASVSDCFSVIGFPVIGSLPVLGFAVT
jgi:hypothetical protein